jgi:hypothetical protein
MNNITTFKICVICVICVPFVIISEKTFMRLYWPPRQPRKYKNRRTNYVVRRSGIKQQSRCSVK